MSKIFRSKGRINRESEKLPIKKKRNEYNRFRNKTVAFRVTAEESDLLNNLVESSGLSKQDYITQAMLEHQITYLGSPKMADGIEKHLKAITKKLMNVDFMKTINKEDFIYLEKILNLYQEIKKEESL